MAAPTPSAPGTPAGIKLKDGYSSRFIFARNTSVSLFIKAVQPVGMDGGDAIVQTTMHNTLWRTKAPKALIDLTNSSATAAYDPNVYNQLLSLINKEDTVTQLFSDGSTIAFYGYLAKFEPGELKEGEQPEAKVEVIATNWDFVNHVEAGPVLTSVAGT